jgi:hypothetical protein
VLDFAVSSHVVVKVHPLRTHLGEYLSIKSHRFKTLKLGATKLAICVGLVGEVLNFYERKRNLQRISLWVYEKFATYCDCFNYHSFYFL